MSMLLQISNQTARRYILGRQGLWPGRRWRSKEGTETALRQAECIQVDTINTIGRSHDLALYSRVQDYRPQDLDALCYQDRKFFDYGGILMLYPLDELPYWRAIMARRRERLVPYLEAKPEVHRHVLDELKRRGPLANRDFEARERIPGGFRTVKDTGAALYYLWLGGQVMTHSRRGFDRVHDLFENITGESLDGNMASLETAERYFARKVIRDKGLATSAEWSRRFTVYVGRRSEGLRAGEMLESLCAAGDIMKGHVEGRKEAVYYPAEDQSLLELLDAGGVPDSWQRVTVSTEEEVTFLAPLDNVIWDRARLLALFDFEYVWEVYKPLHLRRWGYYTLPILWGDRLVGRIFPQLDRKAGVLSVEGLWLEDENLIRNEAFVAALAAGLRRFQQYHGAKTIDVEKISVKGLRTTLKKALRGRR